MAADNIDELIRGLFAKLESHETLIIIGVFVMYIFVGGVALILTDSTKKDKLVIRLTPLIAIFLWPYVLYKSWVG